MDFFLIKLLSFFLIFTRVAAFMFSAPVFSWRAIPVRIKLTMALLTSIFFAMILPATVDAAKVGFFEALLLITGEAIYGLALGLICNFLFGAVMIGAKITERQMGLTMANILDPMTGENARPLSMMMEIIFIMLFFSVNGHHMFLMIISKSFDSFATGSVPSIGVMLTGVLESSVMMLMLGLRLAGPVLAAFMVFMVVLAILARIAPEMNILFLSLPMRVGLGLLMSAIFMPYLYSYIGEFQDWIGKLIIL